MKPFRNKTELRDFLEKKVLEYNHPSFIAKDPVSVPHRFSKKQDIEIAGLFASVFAWGNRTTIVRKSNELMKGMDDAPFDFIKNHGNTDLKRLLHFKHRTFNSTDLLYFIRFLKSHYGLYNSLESAFLPDDMTGIKINRFKTVVKNSGKNKQETISNADINGENEFARKALSNFYKRFFSLKNAPERTKKHIASPDRNSTCKRLNMYLRWMVRKDDNGVDFGIWKKMSASDLICPVDLHVARVARGFGLITRKQTDWQTAMELTTALREMDKTDPVKYDFALFGLGITEKY
ncbi:MAG TPA: TIGR02757 family protein [Puia sp.]|nr:TIGR02757 family protein [Puia sp.]